jgi:CheY-like chemotaxis protein
MEHDLLTAKDKAEESDRLKTAFLNNLSHEIRTPLNAIVGFSELLSDDYPDDQKIGFIEIINNNSDQLLHIIDDVLSVSRLDSEKIPVENEVFSLNEMFDSLYSTFVADAAKHDVLLYPPSLNPDIPDKIYHDKGKIRQVISGFIENAIKYTIKGSIEMDCELVDNQLTFWVKDTGIGIGPKDQKRVFDRFFRANEVQIKAIRGNGLGLSIAKGLIELIGGNIGLESEPGLGTKFFFNIPLLNNPGPYEKPRVIAHGISNWSAYNVLIVEDEPDNYNYLVSILQPRVKSVLNATTGEDAIQLAKIHSIHLVLMDLKLPGIDGVEATRAIKAFKPDLPVIAVSAVTQHEEIKRAMDAGCISYITKPLSKEKLFEAINFI